MKRSLLPLILSFLLLFIVSVPVVAQDDDGPEIVIETSQVSQRQEDSEEGYIPPMYTVVSPNYAMEATKNESLPAKYDAREDGRIPFVKDQGKDGVCWTFAGNSSLEAYFAPDRIYNFSENHVRYSLSDSDAMPNPWGFDRPPSGGGNFTMYGNYLMRWSGPVFTEDDPYVVTDVPRSLDEVNSKPVRFHVQGFLTLPNPAEYPQDVSDEQRAAHVELVKQYIYSHGSVSTSIYHNDAYLNHRTNAYYYDPAGPVLGGNHAVSLVGWDDAYPKTNFKQPQPENNGAFIVKNSWGEDNGDNGYFYLSYEDVYAGWFAGVIDRVDPVDRLDTIYQYDPFGMNAASYFNTGSTTEAKAWFANVFMVQGDEEALEAVSFMTNGMGLEYEVWVNTETGSMDDWSKFQKRKTGTIEMTGYHTVYLDTPVALREAGSKFAVAVMAKTANPSDRLIPLELPVAGDDYSIGNTNATANPGESFICSNPERFLWTDINDGDNYKDSNMSVCLKAYTTNRKDDTPIVSYQFKNAANEAVEAVEAGDIHGEAQYQNKGTGRKNVRSFVALYKDGIMVDCAVSPIYPVDAGKGTTLLTDAVTVPEKTDGYILKQFVWDFDTLSPIADPAQLVESV